MTFVRIGGEEAFRMSSDPSGSPGRSLGAPEVPPWRGLAGVEVEFAFAGLVVGTVAGEAAVREQGRMWKLKSTRSGPAGGEQPGRAMQAPTRARIATDEGPALEDRTLASTTPG
jgi:hypothetical protein